MRLLTRLRQMWCGYACGHVPMRHYQGRTMRTVCMLCLYESRGITV